MKHLLIFIFISLFANVTSAQCEDFEMTLTAHHPTCKDYSDGRVEIVISGGTGYAEISIYDSEGVEHVGLPGGTENVLADGCYFVTAIDELGCEILDSICLIDPLSITADIMITEPTFPGACDGVVAAESVAGYQGPFDLIVYYWTIPGAPNADEVEDVCAGEYSLIINDVNGCTGFFDFALGSLAGISLNEQNEIEVYTNHENGELVIQNVTVNDAIINVFNTAGQTVFTKALSGENIAFIPELSQGIYGYSIHSNQRVIQSGKLAF